MSDLMGHLRNTLNLQNFSEREGNGVCKALNGLELN